MDFTGPFGRQDTLPAREHTDAVLLCVPEQELAAAAARVPDGVLAGHCSASAPLSLLAPHEAFAVHPLMTLQGVGTVLAGAPCAVTGSSEHAREFATALARALGMSPMHVPEDKRALYHAAASMSSNFLVTLEGAAEQAAAVCGVPRQALLPLVHATIAAWAERGFHGAITGPIARGDRDTVTRQRDALAANVPHLLPLFDALATATVRALEEPRRD